MTRTLFLLVLALIALVLAASLVRGDAWIADGAAISDAAPTPELSEADPIFANASNEFAKGQAVATTDSPTFAGLQLSGESRVTATIGDGAASPGSLVLNSDGMSEPGSLTINHMVGSSSIGSGASFSSMDGFSVSTLEGYGGVSFSTTAGGGTGLGTFNLDNGSLSVRTQDDSNSASTNGFRIASDQEYSSITLSSSLDGTQAVVSINNGVITLAASDAVKIGGVPLTTLSSTNLAINGDRVMLESEKAALTTRWDYISVRWPEATLASNGQTVVYQDQWPVGCTNFEILAAMPSYDSPGVTQLTSALQIQICDSWQAGYCNGGSTNIAFTAIAGFAAAAGAGSRVIWKNESFNSPHVLPSPAGLYHPAFVLINKGAPTLTNCGGYVKYRIRMP
jgi:hypothetical protein